MSKLGIGLIGCGVMGRSLAKACNELEHAQVVAVADVVAESLVSIAKELGTVQFQTVDYYELLSRDDVSAVLVALPGYLHAEIAITAAQAEKHVFTEKPMAVTLEDCDMMIDACHRAGVKLMVGQVCRFHGIHSRVKQFVDDGFVGDPTCLIVRRLGGGWTGVWRQGWRHERARCGGTLMEVNAHEIDFMRWVCGEVSHVYATGGKFLDGPQDYEDIMLATLKFESGAIGFLHSSNASVIGEYGGRLDGRDGSLTFPHIWGDGSGISYGRSGEEAKFLPASDIQVEPPVRAELRAFADAILNDTDPPISGRDGRAVVEIALAAYESAGTGQVVEL